VRFRAFDVRWCRTAKPLVPVVHLHQLGLAVHHDTSWEKPWPMPMQLDQQQLLPA
jgi:hypothetical protein